MESYPYPLKEDQRYINLDPGQGRIQEQRLEGGHMASAEREPIMGVWGLCPQRGPGAQPLVRGQSPPEAERYV